MLCRHADNYRLVSFTVSAWEWVYATNFSRPRRERERSKRHVEEARSVLITAILLLQRLSFYWGKIMLTNLRLADLRLTTAQQRSTGQNLPSHLYIGVVLIGNFLLKEVWQMLVTQMTREGEVNLRPTVSRPVCPGVRRPSGTCDQFFFLLEISFRQLRLCYFVAAYLTRGWICNLLSNCFWALPEQSLLGRSPAELTAIFYCLIWDSPNLEDQVPVFVCHSVWTMLTTSSLFHSDVSKFPAIRICASRWNLSDTAPISNNEH
jgi:hypothetical protein